METLIQKLTRMIDKGIRKSEYSTYREWEDAVRSIVEPMKLEDQRNDQMKLKPVEYETFSAPLTESQIESVSVTSMLESLPDASLDIFQAAMTELHWRLHRSNRLQWAVMIERSSNDASVFKLLHDDAMTAAAAYLLREPESVQKDIFLIDWFVDWWPAGGWKVVVSMMEQRAR